MEPEEIEKLKNKLSSLKEEKERFFQLGWPKEKWIDILAQFVLIIICGGAGVGSLLMYGLTVSSAILIPVAFLAYKHYTAREKSVIYCRDQYFKLKNEVYALEEQYQQATFVPDTPEESARKWRELMDETEQMTKPQQ